MSDIKNKSVLSFPIFFEKISDVFSTEDDRFTKVKIWLMHTGENFNGSIFDKSVIEQAVSTLEYIPIVGFIEENKVQNEKDFTNHKFIITKDENGVRRKYIGNAYGVITAQSDNNAHFENRMCDDGIEREFLVVDGICWNMFEDSSDILKRDVIKSHSMELHEPSVDGYADENGKFHFTKFSFRAACILGDGVEPAMHNSTIEVQFTMTEFMRSVQSELDNKYIAFTKIVNGNNEGDKNMQKDNVNVNSDFALSVMQQFENIATIVREHEKITDRWGDEIARYRLVDIQDNEVIVVDKNNGYNYFGLPFTVNGDEPTIDFSNPVRKKIVYENYDDGATVPEGAFDFGKEIEEIETKAFAKVESVNQEVADAKAAQETAESNLEKITTDFEDLKSKYDEYVKSEQARIEAEIELKKDNCFSKFESLIGDDAEFIKLKENRSGLSAEEVENNCYIIYAKKNIAINFSKPVVGEMTSVLVDDGQDDNAGFVVTKYGNIPVKR